LAVSAINGCESCVKAHEKAVVEGGLTPDHVHDAVRIAAVGHAAAGALGVGEGVAWKWKRGAPYIAGRPPFPSRRASRSPPRSTCGWPTASTCTARSRWPTGT